MKIEVDMNKINSVEQIISKMLGENDFNKMNEIVYNKIQKQKNKLLFPYSMGKNEVLISVDRDNSMPFINVISESEFFKIIGVTKKGLSKTSGKYQEYLYNNYLEAIKQGDEGYISDVLYKALEFKANLNYVKSLMRKKSFVKEWRKDFANETAVEVYKHKGTLKSVNIVKERAMNN